MYIFMDIVRLTKWSFPLTVTDKYKKIVKDVHKHTLLPLSWVKGRYRF